jgi:hypothetical protein
MKPAVVIPFIILAAGFAPAQASAMAIWAKDAPDHVGQTATVVGKASVQRTSSGEIYLDLQGQGDGAPVSAYVSRWNASRFADIVRLDGQWVAISGPIGAFRYRPEIFLTSPSQIAVVDAQPEPRTPSRPRPLRIHILDAR